MKAMKCVNRISTVEANKLKCDATIDEIRNMAAGMERVYERTNLQEAAE